MVGCWLAGLFWSRERERKRDRLCGLQFSVYFESLKKTFQPWPHFHHQFFQHGWKVFAGVLGASFVVPHAIYRSNMGAKTSRLWQINPLTISWEENIKLKIPQFFIMNMKMGSFPSIENHIPWPSPTLLLLENVSERNRTMNPHPPKKWVQAPPLPPPHLLE